MQGKIQMVHCKQINADQMEEEPGLEHQSVANVFFHVIPILIHLFAGVRISMEYRGSRANRNSFCLGGTHKEGRWISGKKLILRKLYLDGGETIPSWEFEMINDEIDSMDHWSLLNQDLDWWQGALHDQQKSNLLDSQSP